MFCISGELKVYQGSMGEWIGSLAWQDMGNLPPCLYYPQFVFQGQDLPNLPPCPTQLQTGISSRRAPESASTSPSAPYQPQLTWYSQAASSCVSAGLKMG
jgi:hypothetical protein